MGSKELKRVGGPSTKWWAADVDSPTPIGLVDLDGVNPNKSTTQALDRGPQEKAWLLEFKITRRDCFSMAEPLVS